jgi:hypothetical protein
MYGALGNGIILLLMYMFGKLIPCIAHMEKKSEASQ